MKTFIVRIQGATPLLQHRFTEQAEVELGKGTRTVLVQNELPRDVAARSAYRDDSKGYYYMPTASVTRLLFHAGANHKLKGSRKSAAYAVNSAVRATEDRMKLVDPATGKALENFEVDSRPVLIRATGGRIMRHRPRFDAWASEFSLAVNDSLVQPQFVHQLLTEGGMQIGIGDYRPQKSGPFGTFYVTEWVEV